MKKIICLAAAFLTALSVMGATPPADEAECPESAAMLTVKSSDGYKALDENTRERFDAYVFASRGFTSNVYSAAAALLESEGYAEKDAAAQKAVLEKCLRLTPYNLVNIGEVPEGERSGVKIGGKTRVEEYDVWRGRLEAVWKYTVTLPDGYKLNIISAGAEYDAVRNTARALMRFPAAMRKYLARVIIIKDDADSYNAVGSTIWFRLSFTPTEDEAARALAHEFGHVLDTILTDDEGVWTEAAKADAVPVSGYGNTTRGEDLAEFSRLYHSARRSDEVMEAVGRVYPNRMRAYKALLYKADSDYYKDFKQEYEIIQSAKTNVSQ